MIYQQQNQLELMNMIENDVIPTPVIAPPKTNTPTNQQRLHRNKSLFVY
jgi:hypothetical protein